MAGAPANFLTHLQASSVWKSQAIHKNPGGLVPSSKLPLIHNAVLAACDARDGIKDGLLDDPRRCDFDPKTLECKGEDAVTSRIEDPEQGLAFDFLESPPESPRVLTGHASGIITVSVEEADHIRREQARTSLNEPYRTLVGHFRHEIGHYYWNQIIDGTPWLGEFRSVFGDERADYQAALRRNYREGPPADWRQHYVSAYASVHPREDWAETWARYMHIVDTL